MKEKLFAVTEVKAAVSDTDPTDSIVEFVASDATVDRFGEVIDPAGWQLENYRKNPVFLNCHANDTVLNTLGRAVDVRVRYGKLVIKVQFAVNENPAAKIAYDLYKGGFLRAVSVGFIPIRWEDGKEGSEYRRKYLEAELVEVSAVGVPANPNALMKTLAGPERALAELAALLRGWEN